MNSKLARLKMNINKSINFLIFESESFTSVKRFCLDALREPHLIAADKSIFNNLEQVSTLSLETLLEDSLRLNVIDFIVISNEATKHKALIEILRWLHSLSIKVRFVPQLSEKQALKLPLTLMRSMIL